MNNRSPSLFPHIIVRNRLPRTEEVPQTSTGDNSLDTQLLRSWVEYDPEFDEPVLGHPLNRWTILGITLVIATSGAFWTGVGLLINHYLR